MKNELATYILVALGLSMDAFAVSVSSGICIPRLEFRHGLRAAAFFGLFQFLMPLAGYFVGAAFRGPIRGYDHWIAFGLLAFVGAKMIKEGFEVRTDAACDEEELRKRNILDLGTLVLLSVATSIDALAVGLSYSLLDQPILPPASIIGVLTFLVCLAGCEFGKRLGAVFERWAEVAGGAVLVGIGIKILAEHLSNGL
ncbi:MAG TPA: manganese efflux pump MntP family protein [Spirochaetia bacterium]|nr:manganese efflux pump MntP family protein [Spirochaetales bacterium]HRY78830.1 manganese efflux pump MntP family protein [Spirochaetia bacterium]